jgi:uncharacterized membrane protein YhaH (DUF805 family)
LFAAVAAPIAIALCIFLFTLAARRLHDLDLPDAWALLLLVPGINLAFVLFLLIRPGKAKPNRHGLPPPPNADGTRFLAIATLVLLVFGLAVHFRSLHIGRAEALAHQEARAQHHRAEELKHLPADI